MAKKIAHVTSETSTKPVPGLQAQIRRGATSWAFLYTWLGFALTLETGIIGLIVPLEWRLRLGALFLIAALTVYLFLANGWFQNKMIGLKGKYEDKLR